MSPRSAATRGSQLHLTRDLIALRRAEPDLRGGAYATLPAPAGAWAWRRGERHAVALNLSDAEVTVEGRARPGGHRHRPRPRRRGGRRRADARRLAGRGIGDVVTVEGLDPLLSPEGWVYASTPPVAEGDPGRYHALFGRDSLITALQVLPARPDVARGTLRALAALQGQRDDPETDEEPGKILHEYRPVAPAWHIEHGWPVRDGELRYYGSADSTSWFLVLLAALGDAALTAELEPAWRAAGGWLERALVAGGGLVRYGPREHPGGLTQQGWRDVMGPAADDPDGGGIVRPDGSTPRAPLADTDVQSVAYAALRALTVLSGEEAWSRRAESLTSRLESDFGPGVMALEGDDLPVPGPGSQLGWLLWSGALSPAGARGRGRAPVRARRPDRVGAAHARGLEPGVRPAELPPRQHLAVRLVARLERAARGRPRGRGRARPLRRARRARPARPCAGALRGHARRGARAVAAHEPRAGLDGGGPLGVRERLGRPARLA